MTVVSTITRFTLDALITPARFAVSIVSASNSATPASPSALAPARQARRVNRRLGLQVRFACEHLPVRVLHPLPDDLFIGQIERMLQIQ